LSPMCRRDSEYWRLNAPIIYYHVVEWHLPIRVMRQFGRLQHPNVEHPNTSRDLHKIDRRKFRGAINWAEKHQVYVQAWANRFHLRMDYNSGPVHRPDVYKQYLVWLHQNSRFTIKAPIAAKIADFVDSDGENEIVDE
ncbi:hypothetical protein BAE44_0009055, partial [Dichanthelium oligosanthes]